MKIVVIILFILCSCEAAYNQINRPAVSKPVKSMLLNAQHKVKEARDSIAAVAHPLQQASAASKKTMTVSNRRDTALPGTAAGALLPGVQEEDEPSAYLLQHRNCKGVVRIPIYAYEYVPVMLEPVRKTVQPLPPVIVEKVPFLQVHGNVLYNVNYYSHIDTPYNERNVYQHTVQTYLDVTVKGQYPVRVYLTNRFSNSSLFRNFNDLNFNYNNVQFNQKIKAEVRKQFMTSLPSPTVPDSLHRELEETLKELRLLEGWVKNPALLQKMVEAREQALRKKIKDTRLKEQGTSLEDTSSRFQVTGFRDSMMARLPVDTTAIDQLYEQKKHQIDSLKSRAVLLQQMIKKAGMRSAEAVNRINRAIDQANDPATLKALIDTLHIADTVLPKGYKTLMAVRSFGVGRSVVNYSELSAKNISINGLQAEYNPSAYYALATGGVDYRFRDFIVRNGSQSHQYLTVLRYGRGLKDGNNVIFTWYAGRRQLYNAQTTDTSQMQVPSSGLMGFTVEGHYRLTDHINITAEVAKSSYPAYAGDAGTKSSLPSQMLQMNNRHNEAYSLKADALFPKTQTTVKASLKRLGANFQSFSTFTDGTAQTAWSVGVQQLLFKRRLMLTGAVNTNDFSNPFIGGRYKSTTVFKSIQATWRAPKWPVMSVGYFPSSQITKLGDGQYRENLFYTLTGNITHSYRSGPLMMNSALMYTQFYNRSTDSGFVYFNTKNILLSQSAFWRQLTLQTNASGAFNQDYRLYTLEGKASLPLLRRQGGLDIMIGAGVKYNYQTVFDIQQWGYSAETTVQIPKLGQIQISGEKGFIPGMNRQLVPNNTGRATYFKTF